MKARLLLGLVTLLAVALPARAALPRIGMQGPMTGSLAKQGQDMRNATRLAVDEAKAAGGPAAEILVGDDKGDPREGILAARHLVTSGVLGVVGPYNSGVTIPVTAEVYAPAWVPVLTVSTNPRVTDRGLKTVFRVIGRDDQQGLIAARESRKLGARTAAVLHNKNAYGQGLATEFRKAFEAAGGQVLFFDGVASGEKDFSATLTRLRAGKPDLLYFGGEYQDAGPLLRQARNLGIKARFLAGDATLDPTFVSLAGAKAAEGAMVTFPAPAAADFDRRYTAKFGPPGPYSGYAYDAARILLAAIKRARTPAPREVAQEIARTRDFPGVTGKISFDAKGDLTRAGFILWEVKGGKWAPAAL
ncbi:MAG: branched-chain amino acid ABC transporter substrate-binding protein [Candidatus Sericytochromatia bacterium]|nr:branched-chain amino acid ABC transporter substrate-binding protein [Candidatus Tanganyikabacteria bacterium]